MKSKKTIITILAVILVVVIGAVVYKSNNGNQAANPKEQTAASSNVQAPAAKETLTFGVAPGPYGDMIKIAIKPGLEAKGYKVEIKEFSDYVQPNLALNNGEITANMFQHVRYLKKFSADKGLSLSELIKIPTAAAGIYSKKLTAKNADELKSQLKKGDVVTIPNDPTNLARALVLLRDTGLITINKKIDPTKASERDIAKNPYGLVVQPVEAAQLPRTLDTAALAVINGNYAIAAKIPLASAIVKEKLVEETKNLIAVRTADIDKQFAKDIKEVVESEAFKNEIENGKYEFKDFQRPDWYKNKWSLSDR